MLTNIQNILFPTDFSDNARNALPFALEIAKMSGARLTLHHCINESYNFAPMVEELKEKARAKVDALLTELIAEIQQNPEYSNVKVQPFVASGSTLYSILEHERETKPDLVVMGTKGATGLKKILFGSVTSDVILYSGVPILAVPEHCTFNGLSSMTFTTNYHDGDVEALKELISLARLFGAKVTTLHVDSARNLYSEITFRGFRELAREQNDFAEINFKRLFHDSFYIGISDYLSGDQTHLLSITRYDASFFHNLTKHNHAREIAFQMRVPLLVLVGSRISSPEYWLQLNAESV